MGRRRSGRRWLVSFSNMRRHPYCPCGAHFKKFFFIKQIGDGAWRSALFSFGNPLSPGRPSPSR